MIEMKPLVIGDLTVEKPVIQGGMGVGISLHRLAGAVAKAGGVGLISAAQIGFTEPDFAENPEEANARAIHKEMKLAREIAPDGVIGFNIMVATKHYDRWVKEAVKAGADLIVSGAGLPVTLPEHVKEAYEEMGGVPGRRVKLAPIVSTAKSATVICKLWDRKYHMAPDLVVIEGPLAGGHLGFSLEQLTAYGADTEDVPATYKRDAYDEEIRAILKVVSGYGEKYGVKVPVVVAGGIYTHEDLIHQLELGADGVQVATRFVTTEECDAPLAYKEAYIQAKKEDIIIIKSPVGMPGRAIYNSFMAQVNSGKRPPIPKCYRCLEHCDIAKIPYCITQALVNAAQGDEDNALLFCGSNAYRAERITTVDEVMDALMNGEKE
ncbi:MAG TPA: nitronate monooxygenase family protein [Candidatus Enterocloster faecavium]|uniref:Probable nitronate monooxygenase n=1 Tax=Candidatus Enterocloster faecavium TaxID=2838560 RepID=A0A9D2RLW8_9FIRM|nr:nitronate monooxygenase family protein [Candidatus Enterocloster faecavium]